MKRTPKDSFEWMEENGTEPPRELCLHSTVAKNGDTQAMAFIKYVCTPFIPKHFWHQPYLQNADGKTVAILCVERDIPVLYNIWQHNPNIQDNDGNTIAMIAILHDIRVEPWMRCDPNMQNKDGNTVAMVYLQRFLQDPPEWMHHNPDIQDKNGNTIAMLYVATLREEPAYWMRGKQFLRNIKHATLYDVWCNLRSDAPPEWIKQPPYTIISSICKCCAKGDVKPTHLYEHMLVCDTCAKNNDCKKRVYYDSNECAICKSKMSSIVVMNGCGHIFCKKCVDNWLNHGNSCPFGCALAEN